MKKYMMLTAICLLLSLIMGKKSSLAFEIGEIKIHGYLSQGYLKTDHNNFMAETEDGTFQFNEFGLNFTTRLTDDLTAGLQFFGRDMGEVGNDEVRVDWAYLDYRWRDWAGVRIGKTKLAYGLYNEIQELDMLRTSVILPQSVYVEVFRDSMAAITGIEFYGNFQAADFGSFSYNLNIGILPFKAGDGVSQAIDNFTAKFKFKVGTLDSDYATSYGITWDTPLDGLRFRYSWLDIHGLSSTGSAYFPLPDGSAITSYELEYQLVRFNVLSCEFTSKDLTLAAEYMEMDLFDKINFGPVIAYENTPYQGWYVSASYRLVPFFSIGLSYSEFFNNTNDKDGDLQVAVGKKDYQTWQKTYTLSTRFDLNKNLILKLEASYNDGFGAVQPVYNDPEKLEPYWWLFAAKVTVNF